MAGFNLLAKLHASGSASHEKKTPHCRLARIKSLIATGHVRTTSSTVAGASALGIDRKEVIRIVASLQSDDFYKSMTSHLDRRIWQDVYRPLTSYGAIYLKLTVVDDVLIVSFKEL